MYLQLIQTQLSELNTFPHDTGTVYLCTDVSRVYIDRDDHYRANITKSSVLCETEDEFNNLGGYRDTCLYIIINDNKFYLSSYNNEYKQVMLYSQLVNVIIQDPKTLNPKVLRQNGNAIAPRTTTNAIFDKNGINMAETLESFRNDVRNLNKVFEKTVICYNQGQTIFTLPYPTYDYEVTTDNLFVMINNVYKDPSTYTINDTKIIFNDGLNYNDVIKFIFHYHVVQNINDVPDKSVSIYSLKDELREMIINNGEFDDIIFPDGTSLNQKLNQILEILTGEDDNGGINDNITQLVRLVNEIKDIQNQNHQSVLTKFTEYDEKMTEIDNKLDTIINNTSAELTSMSAVKRVQRGVSMIELNSESIEITLEHEINPDKVSIKLNGDSYYNESPYVYQVFSDRFIVRQKSPNVTPDYTSYFSWEVIEFI